jgi:anti-anti-sigma factor
MDVELERLTAGTVVRIRGEVDLATSPKLDVTFSQLEPPDGVVVIDLSGVTFIDSSGLNALVQLRQRFAKQDLDHNLRLVVTRPATIRVFEVTGLLSVFVVSESVADALAST